MYTYTIKPSSLYKKYVQHDSNQVYLTWNKWGTFDTSILTNLLVHEIAIAHYLLGPLQSILTEDIQDDAVTLRSQHEKGTVHITINRKSKAKSKTIRLVAGVTEYILEGNKLTSTSDKSSGVLYDSPDQDVLKNECMSFLKETRDELKKNNKRQQIDISVASVLQMLSAK